MNDSSTGKYGIPGNAARSSGRYRAGVPRSEVGVLVRAVLADRVCVRQRVVVLGVLGHEGFLRDAAKVRSIARNHRRWIVGRRGHD